MSSQTTKTTSTKTETAATTATDPFTVTTAPEDASKFDALDYWGQFDAAVNNPSKADVKNLPLFFIAGLYWTAQAALVLGLTWSSPAPRCGAALFTKPS